MDDVEDDFLEICKTSFVGFNNPGTSCIMPQSIMVERKKNNKSQVPKSLETIMNELNFEILFELNFDKKNKKWKFNNNIKNINGINLKNLLNMNKPYQFNYLMTGDTRQFFSNSYKKFDFC